MHNNTPTTPKPNQIENTCHVIRSHWTSTKTRERQRMAKAKQRQLVRWLAGGQASCQHAV